MESKYDLPEVTKPFPLQKRVELFKNKVEAALFFFARAYNFYLCRWYT
ncbi:Uncharacterised protein [Legionella oakridgensis]|uniref:Uncharacterized protein n=1 Tax=Legionella longbeachae serogroup 1 (strain NSW150) TaxID=661367 RepID=D3HT14_LEGLN|nr:hypothetical protein LLB_3729 [Legionella longbeachae D-4968]CBJ12056.1 hypothetical protein LLO_1680 [Legionella longbeachae NSW150]VEE02547.1 Uncharacterised protein [Legionella oakridgensis]